MRVIGHENLLLQNQVAIDPSVQAQAATSGGRKERSQQSLLVRQPTGMENIV